ncbi:hypothetical protein DFP72DRAFT_913145 [Ephemerocybe angulata]|uniref:F-box domain-containing protein n=1 Tax=Ephemerocybe angulata TaxID=980116 RepID=A0A8H6HM98_9AGAR|nr:hypothetical protein DFP72DRAFT_913145 [Tulosesus angulatus]
MFASLRLTSAAKDEGIATPFPRLLRCNEPPSEVEREAILEHIASVREEVQRLPGALDPGGGTVKKKAAVDNRRKACAEFIRLHINLLYGLRGLPDEVLETILHHTVQSAPDRHRSISDILRTCHLWREVVLLSPRIWSVLPDIIEKEEGLDFDVGLNRLNCESALTEVFSLYLQRSGDHPLTFIFCPGPPIRTARLLEYDFIFSRLLVPNSHRWANVRLYVPCFTLKFAGPQLENRLPLLHSLHLKVYGVNHMEGRVLDPVDCFRACPSLRHVFLESAATGQETTPIDLPWPQLSTFYESTWSRGVSYVCMKDVPGTRDIKYHLRTGDRACRKRILSRFSTFTITVLHLNFGFGSNGVSEWFSDELTLPSLTDLAINYNTIPASSDLSAMSVLAFVRRSGCSLKRLVADGSGKVWDDIAPGTLTHLLLLCDELEELQCGPIPFDTLKYLTIDPANSGSILAPRLRIIKMEIPGLDDNTGGGQVLNLDCLALNEMARSRVDPSIVGYAGVEEWFAKPAIVLRVSDENTYRTVFHVLEGNLPSGSIPLPTSPVEEIIKNWSELLSQVTAFSCYEPQKPGIIDRMKPAYRTRGRELLELTKELEGHRIQNSDLLILQKYNIPGLLDQCAIDSAAGRIPCAPSYKIPERLQAVRDKWRPLLMQENTVSRRWVLSTGMHIVYIPADSELREGDGPWTLATGGAPAR